ncbi:unnamed protein product [Spirodela intermedia]|uniref:F-box domain-containing protein n=1 Tax=Spirodela intermedia TaxID=51605 RepID=A0ABN7EAZ9_SPIIN|nr:unnamed protein product [Spirodela intermedia]
MDYSGPRELPKECGLEILSWSPAKQVARCRSLCKSFYTATQSRSFHLLQARRAKADAGVFLRGHFVGSQLVFTDESAGGPASSRLLLYNPARRTSLPLGRPGGAKILNNMSAGATILLGDGVDMDVVCVTPTDYWSSFMECWLYSSGERRWKLVSDKVFVGPRNIKSHHPVPTSSGLIYLTSTCGRYHRQDPYIVAVDVKVGSSRILPLPEKAVLASDDGDIEIRSFTIYDMKDPDRWVWEERGLQVNMTSMGLEPRPIGGFSLVNSDILVFTVEEYVYVYDMHSGGGRKFISRLPGCRSYIYSYANTLRPCGRSEEG